MNVGTVFFGCGTKSLAFLFFLFYSVVDIHEWRPICRWLCPNATSHIDTSTVAGLQSALNEWKSWAHPLKLVGEVKSVQAFVTSGNKIANVW